MQQGMFDAGAEAVEVLRERLEREPASMTNKELMDLVKLTADRTGHGPKKTIDRTETFNVNINEALSKGHERARRAAEPVDVEFEDVPAVEDSALPVPYDPQIDSHAVSRPAGFR